MFGNNNLRRECFMPKYNIQRIYRRTVQMVKTRLLILCAVMSFIPTYSGAWSLQGHKIVVGIAQRHLTERTISNISAIMPYDMKEDAGWMDSHRKDSVFNHAGLLHTFAVDSSFNYDPNARIRKGDIYKGLFIADYNLRRLNSLSDSLKLLSLRMIIHFVGDLNCPVHSAAPGYVMAGDWYFNGRNLTNFHRIYDQMPNVLFKGRSADETAALLDRGISKKQINEWTSGSFTDWMSASAHAARLIYDINPVSPEHGDKILAPDTYERSQKLIEERLLAAGYQLAMLLNLYFDK